MSLKFKRVDGSNNHGMFETKDQAFVSLRFI